MLASVTGSVTSFVGDHGVYAVFVLMLLSAVIPAASEVVMLYAGAVATGAFADAQVVLFGHEIPSGGWAYLAMSVAGVVGCFFGALAGWAIGVFGGRPLLERHGRWLHVTPAKLDRAEGWFDRYGGWTVAVGLSVPFGRYTLLTIPGSALWCFAFAGIGWAVGKSYKNFHHAFDYVDVIVVAGALFLVLYLVWKRRSSRLKARA